MTEFAWLNPLNAAFVTLPYNIYCPQPTHSVSMERVLTISCLVFRKKHFGN